MKVVRQAIGIGLVGVLAGSACGEYPAAEQVAGTQAALSVSSYPGTPSNLSKNLSASLLRGSSTEVDNDHDALVDDQENALADQFRPYIFFDSNEIARRPNEPYTYFQVRPVDLNNATKVVRIKYVFAFELDGGYGPANTFCFTDSHAGDLEGVTFRVVSSDGVTWTLDSVQTWGPVSWSRHQDGTLLVSGGDLVPGHPIMFLAGSKHHQHLTDADDDQNSQYSEHGCNDNVNGSGAKVLVDLKSIGAANASSPYNNLGEPELHNDLGEAELPASASFLGDLAIDGAPIFQYCTVQAPLPGGGFITYSGLPPSSAQNYAVHQCAPYHYNAWTGAETPAQGDARFYSGSRPGDTIGSWGGQAMRHLMVGPVGYSLTDFTSSNAPPVWCMDGALVSGFECAGDYCGSVALRCTTTRDRVTAHVWTPYFSEEAPSEQICSGGFVNAVECRGDNCDDLSFQCVTLDGVSPQNCRWIDGISEEQAHINFGSEASRPFYLAGARCAGRYCDTVSFYVCQRSTVNPGPQPPTLPTSSTSFTSEEYQPGYCGDNQLVSGVYCRGDYCDNIGFKCSDVPGSTGQSATWTPYFSEESPSSKTCDNGFAVGIRCHHDYCDNISLLCSPSGNGAPQDCTWTTATLSEEQRDIDFPPSYYLAGVKCFGDFCDNKQFYLCKSQGSGTGGGASPLPSDTPVSVTLGPNEQRTFYADNWPSKGNPNWTANVVLSVNSLGGKPIPAGTVTVNGVPYAIGGNGLYYQVVDISNSGPYTITISITASDTIQLMLGNR